MKDRKEVMKLMVGKGQPPKKPEDKRVLVGVWISPKEKAIIEKARDKQAEGQSLSRFIRESALMRAESINQEK